MVDRATRQPVHRPSLGFFSATALVIASMIGAGVFTISGFSLAALGSPEWVLVAWAIGGVVATAGAISYGALAQQLRESGGEYVYLARRVHPLAGFLAGWVSLLAGFTGALAFAATAFEVYAAPLLGVELRPGLIAAGIIVLCCIQHALRVEGGAWLQNAIVAVKIAGLISLVLAGWWWLGAAESVAGGRVATPDWWTLANQLTWIYLAYSGFNAAVYVAEEVREPERTVPRAMLAATLLVSGLYLALNAVFVYAAPIDQLAGEPDIAATAIGLLGGEVAGTACRVLICLALASSVSALIMSGPRVYAKMAADGLFPIPVPAAGTSPRAAIVLQGVLAMVVALFTTLQQQLDYLGFVLMLSAAGTVASLYWARPQDAHPQTSPWQRAAAAVFVVSTLTFAFMSARREPMPSIVAGGATIVTGLAAYYAMRLSARRAN